MKQNRISPLFLGALLLGAFYFSVGVHARDDGDITIKRRIEPNYPNWAYTHAIGQGYAKIAFYVDEYGESSEFLAIEYSHEAFADALLNAILNWKFVPAHREGQPIKSVCHAYWEFLPDRPIVTNALFDVSKRIDQADAASFRNLRYRMEDKLDNKLQMLKFPPVIAPADYKASKADNNQVTVKCNFFVDMDGNVRLPFIVSTTDPSLNEAVRASLAETAFSRPSADGDVVIAWLEKTYSIPVVLRAAE